MVKIQVLDPTMDTTQEPLPITPTLQSLRGARIGLVDNTKYNSDRLLLRIAQVLEQQHGAAGHVLRKKKKAGVAAHDEIIEEFKRGCDLVVAGIGD